MSSWDFNVATFNTQGLRMDNLKTVSIARDAEKRNIWVKGLTKRQIRESTIEQPGGNKKKCTANHNGIEGTNWHKGVGILIEGEISSTFTRVNDRNCYTEVQLDKYKVILLVAYDPTLMIYEQSRCLLVFAKEHYMILTNTIFNHKMCHRITLTAPERMTDHNYHDGNPRRNPNRPCTHQKYIKKTCPHHPIACWFRNKFRP